MYHLFKKVRRKIHPLVFTSLHISGTAHPVFFKWGSTNQDHLLLKDFLITFIVVLHIRKYERKAICGTGVGKDVFEVMKNSIRN